MSSFAALLRSSAKLQAASSRSNSIKLQLALQRWQVCSDGRAFSAKADDQDGNGSESSVSQRGSWRSWVEEQLSGIDQAALKEQQQVTARQLQQQQKAQASASDSPDVQQSALADAREEVAGHGDEDQGSATSRLGLSSEAPGDAASTDLPDRAVVEQSVSQLSAADPAEVSPQTDPEPMVETPAPRRLSEAAELSVDERIDVFLEAIRNRSWEQTSRQPVNWADGAKPDIQLPPSGYSEIGGIGSSKVKGQMLNPGRTFYPGQAYEPEDLLAPDPSVRFTPRRELKRKSVVRSNKEVMASADFRNLEFLNEFVTEGGQIVPRSKSKLQAKVHRHLARQIKTARIMALLPHSGRLRDFDRGPPDFADDDFDPDGTVNDSLPGYRRLMQAE